MYKETKKALEKISISEATCGIVYGKIIREIYFKKDKASIFFNHKNKSYSLLVEKSTKTEERQQILKFTSMLVELILYLQQLEAENLIYSVKEKNNEIDLFSEGIDSITNGSIEGEYNLSSNMTLSNNGGIYEIKKDEEILLIGLCEEKSLYSDLNHYFYSRIYPTPDLEEYIKGGFKNKDLQEAIKANQLSKRSIRLAWFAAIFTPFISLLLGNCFGITSIENSQFKELLHTIVANTPNNKVETISTPIQTNDTILKIKENDCVEHIKQKK